MSNNEQAMAEEVTVWTLSGWVTFAEKMTPMDAMDEAFAALREVAEGHGGEMGTFGFGPVGRGTDVMDILREARVYDSTLEHIIALHLKAVKPDGGTDGYCQECDWIWPCRTYHVAMGWGEPDECRADNWCKHAAVPYPE